jgi:hypothetical protein
MKVSCKYGNTIPIFTGNFHESKSFVITLLLSQAVAAGGFTGSVRLKVLPRLVPVLPA